MFKVYLIIYFIQDFRAQIAIYHSVTVGKSAQYQQNLKAPCDSVA